MHWILCLLRLSINPIQSTMRCENSTLLCIKWPLTPQYKTHPHVSTHNFLNIQLFFNPQKVLESWAETEGFSTIPSLLYMSILSILDISISNAFDAIYVDTVDTKHIHTFLLITFLIFNRFSIRKKFWKAELRLRAFQPYHYYYICQYCRY